VRELRLPNASQLRKIEDIRTKYGATDEQIAVLMSLVDLREGDTLVVRAGPGTGKSTTLKWVAEVFMVPDPRIQRLKSVRIAMFSKALADPMKAEMSGLSGCVVGTLHSAAFLFYRSTHEGQAVRFGKAWNFGNTQDVREIAKNLGMELEEMGISAGGDDSQALRLVVETVVKGYQKFLNSRLQHPEPELLDADSMEKVANAGIDVEYVNSHFREWGTRCYQKAMMPHVSCIPFEHGTYVKVRVTILVAT
jgi:superfamily I DNA/RNA helicase